jgi:putative transposase
VGTAAACKALGIPRTTVYRWRKPQTKTAERKQRSSLSALSAQERAVVLDVLHWERFVDDSPAQVYATLLDEGTYLASERTMYRILAANDEVRERRNQLRHPNHAKPELLTTGRTTTSTSSSMSSAATSWAGWWRTARAPNWRND